MVQGQVDRGLGGVSAKTGGHRALQNADPHMQIARKVRFVEQAKIALIDQVADIYRSVQSGSERELADSLGRLIAIAYAMGQQMDVPLSSIDQVAERGLPKHPLSEWASQEDLDIVLRHLKAKR